METTDLINDINALMKKTQAAAESTTLPVPAAPQPKPAPVPQPSTKPGTPPSIDDLEKALLIYAQEPDGEDSKAMLRRAVNAGSSDFRIAALTVAITHSELQKDASAYNPDSYHLLDNHPQRDAILTAAYHTEKGHILSGNDYHTESFEEYEKGLLAANLKIFWYRLIFNMWATLDDIRKGGNKGLPGKLGGDLARYKNLPKATAGGYITGLFFSLVFTAALLFFLWCPPLREFLVTTIQPEHLLHLGAVIIVLMIFIAGWGGAIITFFALALVGAGIEHFFGEQALATTLIILIYLTGGTILFLLARSTGYKKLRRNKGYRKTNAQRKKLRKELDRELRLRVSKLDQIIKATELDTNSTPELMYWVAIMDAADSISDFRQLFQRTLKELRSMYADALNSL